VSRVYGVWGSKHGGRVGSKKVSGSGFRKKSRVPDFEKSLGFLVLRAWSEST